MQNSIWVLKVGSPNLTKGTIFTLHEAAGGIPSLFAKSWGQQMQCGKDVTIKSWVPRILTIARESWGGGQAFDRQQRCCLVFRAGPQTRCAFPGFTHTVHCSENPLQTTQHVIHNRLKYIPGKHSNKSMAQAYTPFVGPCFQHKIKGKGREYKGNKSSKQTSRRKQEGSHSLPPPIYKMQQKLGEAKNRNVCHKNVQV